MRAMTTVEWNGRVTAVAVACLGIWACGDVRTGVFIDGPVIGLRYETLTRSGLTTSAGEFEYAAGETVTFTVGGVVLGTAYGKARVTPFDLFGLTPPADTLTLRQLLRDRVVTDFDRALNVALFLHALDADRDPANGIDVTSWGATLAGVPFAFDASFADFAYSDFQRFAAAHPGVNRRIDAASVVAHLYSTLGLSVVSQVPVTRSVDYGADGRDDVTSTFTADDLGRIVRIRGDSDGNGAIDREDFTAYDARGRVSGTTYTRDTGEDGIFERVESTRVVFDDDGNVISTLVQDTTNGVVGLAQSFTFTYDIAGNLLTSLQRNDNGGNGSVESGRSETYTYDRDGRLLSTHFASDADGDEVADAVTTQTRLWSTEGYLMQTVTTFDGDADGVAESGETVSYERDADGRALAQTSEVQFGGTVVTRSQRVFTYDANGNRLRETYDEDADADGSVDYRSSTTTSYIDDGRALDETTATDTDADGNPDAVTITTRVYDALLNLSAETFERDTNGDGVIDSRISNERSYDPFGNQLSRSSRADTNNDGATDSQTLESTTYSDIADGIYHIVHAIVVGPTRETP